MFDLPTWFQHHSRIGPGQRGVSGGVTQRRHSARRTDGGSGDTPIRLLFFVCLSVFVLISLLVWFSFAYSYRLFIITSTRRHRRTFFRSSSFPSFIHSFIRPSRARHNVTTIATTTTTTFTTICWLMSLRWTRLIVDESRPARRATRGRGRGPHRRNGGPHWAESDRGGAPLDSHGWLTLFSKTPNPLRSGPAENVGHRYMDPVQTAK